MDQTNRPTIIERAFELAGSGKVESLASLRRQLTKEGFSSVSAHIQGAALTKQLNAMIRALHPITPPAKQD